MRIAHIAIWCKDIERTKTFYEKYFQAKAGNKYINNIKQFESYFLEFENTDTKIELMHKPNITELPVSTNVQHLGLAHVAFGTKNREQVESLTQKLREDGYYIAGEPRVTGDGYYESIVLDPEGNIVEICNK